VRQLEHLRLNGKHFGLTHPTICFKCSTAIQSAIAKRIDG